MDPHPQAKKIVETLAQAGFVAYYAGGWVRDLLLNHPSDDIDIATNAPPETIQALFPHTVPIGIAFGIILVIVDSHQYEVATFRQDIDYKDGRRPTKIAFTTAVEDAKRRDFTVNGMFYDPMKEEVIDYVEGKADLEKKLIRAIGNPHERIKEDRLRMIRGIRLACRFDFTIEENTAQAIRDHVNELFPAVAIERIWQEFVKGHNFGKLRQMLAMLHEFHLLPVIFPTLKNVDLEEIEKRLLPIKDYPAKAPTIASILALFPNFSLKEKLELCRFLKLSSLDQQFISFLDHTQNLLKEERPIELYEWAYLYANSFSMMALQIISAHLNPREKQAFFKEHEERMNHLAPFIQRIKDQDPLIKSKDLMEFGVKPGVSMGKLLKEAEKISINRLLEEKELIFEELKKHLHWPRS